MAESKTNKNSASAAPPPTPSPFELGLQAIVESKNPGYANAFPNRPGASETYRTTRTEFLRAMDKVDIYVPNRNLPEQFDLTVKFSPIALFKRWVFTLSNKPYLKVSERDREFEKDYYIFQHEDFICFQTLTTNIAHEKFLLTVFEKKLISDFTAEFKTFFNEERKLFLFKDYIKRKASFIKVSPTLLPGRLYDVKVAVAKDLRALRFKVWVHKSPPVSQIIKFAKGKKSEEKEKIERPAPAARGEEAPVDNGFKSLEDHRKEVIQMLQALDKTKKKTNTFANYSLGRVNKIPVLINLASKHKDIPIKLAFTRNQELVVFDAKDMEIKSFTVSKNPKSNWLEKK